MSGPQRHPSVGRRILDMSLTWLIVGATIGAMGGLRTGRLVELASGVLGGMIVLPIAGALLGLIGGDAKGSVVGAVGGLMDCSPCRRRRRRFRGWSPGLLIFLFSLAILALERLDVGQVQVRIATFFVAFERLAISNLGEPDVSLVFGGPAQSDLDVSLLRR